MISLLNKFKNTLFIVKKTWIKINSILEQKTINKYFINMTVQAQHLKIFYLILSIIFQILFIKNRLEYLIFTLQHIIMPLKHLQNILIKIKLKLKCSSFCYVFLLILKNNVYYSILNASKRHIWRFSNLKIIITTFYLIFLTFLSKWSVLYKNQNVVQIK